MGRHRTKLKHLPVRMRMRHGCYYHVSRIDGKQQWLALGKDYGEALRQWSALEDASTKPVLTVADALAHYLDDRCSRLAAKTMKEYRAQSRTLGAHYTAVLIL